MDGKQSKVGANQRDGEESSCTACQRPDWSEDMVQCDHCDVWKHFSCAGVNESVAGKPFTCGDCSVQQNDDVISLQSASSRSSSASVFSVCLSELVERQQMERARLELELQRRHLNEQQKLIDKAFGLEETVNHTGEVNHETISSTASKLPAVSSLSEATVAKSNRRSKSQSEIRKSTTPVMVSIPLTRLEPNTVKYLQGKKDPQAAMQELRNRVEQCETRANPTPDQLTSLHNQLELCRKILEGFQTSSGEHKSDPINPIQLLQPKPTNTSCEAKQTGTIPKASRALQPVSEHDRMQPHRPAEPGAVGGAKSPSDVWP
ncbi:uncharacterized protein LOC134208804 [Armigeres subalbatus]|uniref:uncharacterized protein LOC134208804 n=1 Tax=Armigeres subalbatus TaxID=124917 RepID=UPI002ED20D85